MPAAAADSIATQTVESPGSHTGRRSNPPTPPTNSRPPNAAMAVTAKTANTGGITSVSDASTRAWATASARSRASRSGLPGWSLITWSVTVRARRGTYSSRTAATTATKSNISAEKTMAAEKYPGGRMIGVSAPYLSARVSKSAGSEGSWARCRASHEANKAST